MCTASLPETMKWWPRGNECELGALCLRTAAERKRHHIARHPESSACEKREMFDFRKQRTHIVLWRQGMWQYVEGCFQKKRKEEV